jgi:hypothetical protein
VDREPVGEPELDPVDRPPATAWVSFDGVGVVEALDPGSEAREGSLKGHEAQVPLLGPAMLDEPHRLQIRPLGIPAAHDA